MSEMSPPCGCCRESMNKLNQQVSVMRKEIKNLRQVLDSSVRAHRKQLACVQAAVSKMTSCQDQDQNPSSPQSAPEQGIIQTLPIGYITSCFSLKNGTPRQPTVCSQSRAQLRIQQSVFNNAEHALLGLEPYSHIWIIFLFHKNGRLSSKAKVKPPRLDGQRVGVYSTRSPHRPNALGLTLAQLDKISGDTLHLSGIDMIDGTPVLDIKPYIPEYDSPDRRMALASQLFEPHSGPPAVSVQNAPFNTEDKRTSDDDDGGGILQEDRSETDICFQNAPSDDARFVLSKETCRVLEEVRGFISQDERKSPKRDCPKPAPATSPTERLCRGEEASATVAGWIREPPVACLDVRFTPHAERQLAEFLPAHLAGLPEDDRPSFKFLRGPEEAVAAIRGVLSADPRSVYRRSRCRDRLFFFTIDTAHVTCWFGQGFVEVLQVRPVEDHKDEELHT